jgi:hypothetical protein
MQEFTELRAGLAFLIAGQALRGVRQHEFVAFFDYVAALA